ncbi:hypothetical protein ABTX81_01735 [Kitasatospora sp. NPDC097605]|uniref:hypothetical protein n=1 Tax=Kitasatospora sp. NPDC097605 TaxID=3157226 RepID=UPI00332F1BC1
MTGSEPDGNIIGLAGLEPATVDDLTAAQVLLHCGLTLDPEHESGLAASSYLGTDRTMVLAARVTRDQQAGTYTVRLHRAADPAAGRAWLRAQEGARPAVPAERRTAALASSTARMSPPATTAPVPKPADPPRPHGRRC